MSIALRLTERARSLYLITALVKQLTQQGDHDLNSRPPFGDQPPTRSDRFDDLLGVAPARVLTADQRARFEANTAEMFEALGMDLDTPGTAETPRRFVQALFDATAGYDGDPKLVTVFPTECHSDSSCDLAQIVEGPIPFFALCEHHALPFFGEAYVGYVAHEHIIGISKLTRLVRVVTQRFGVQERMTHNIADVARRTPERARRRCLHEGASPVHPDARRARGLGHDPDEQLSRRLRARPEPPLRVLPTRRHRQELSVGSQPPRRRRCRRLLGTDSELGARAAAGLPAALRSRYDGDLIVPLVDGRPTVIGNFVSTLDGVVAFDRDGSNGGGEVSGFFEPDRFVMALLRGLADVVMVGAGTVRADPRGRWVAQSVHPATAADDCFVAR